MSVVVTGAAGFIGAQAVAALRSGGHRVVAIDRRPPAPAPGVVPLVADLADPPGQAVATALREAEAVLHLAGLPGVRERGPGLARRRWRDNVEAGRRVLTATPAGVPVVVASSSSVYGGARREAGRLRASREEDPLRPRGGYAYSKAALEALCRARAARGGHVGVARPFTVAGEGQRPDMAVARWIAAAGAGRAATLLGSADRRRDITDVRDVVAGLVAMLEREVTGAVNLGSGVSHRLGAVLAAVEAAVGRALRVRVRPAGPQEVEATLAHTRRAARLLEVTPSTDLAGLVARQAAHTGALARPAAV